MRDHINALVKKREGFRPFAPAVTAEAAADYFENQSGRYLSLRVHVVRHPVNRSGGSCCRLSLTSMVRPGRRWLLRLVIPASGSCSTPSKPKRPAHPAQYLFNLRGQPIIYSPEIALDTFAGSEIDVLVIGDYIITHRK
jgi:carbamoyltransferase